MTLISSEPVVSKTFTFYLYDLAYGPDLIVESEYKRVDILESDLSFSNKYLVERAVVYFPLSQQGTLPKALQSDRYMTYLKACSLTVPRDALPAEIEEEEKRNHRFDSKEAFKLFELAAKQKLPEAQHNLGFCYVDGKIVKVDTKKGIALYKDAAKQGLFLAHCSLGAMYLGGGHVKKNDAESFYHYEKGAKQGFAPAQCSLASMYTEGKRVKQDLSQAYHWHMKAADQGFAPSQLALSSLYYNGVYVEKNFPVAFGFALKSAEQGFVRAEYSVAKSYHFGLGTQIDLKLAAQWYQKAADKGFVQAKEGLKKLQNESKSVNNAAIETEKNVLQLKLQNGFQQKFQTLMSSIAAQLVQYQDLRAQWSVVMNKELAIKSLTQIQEIEAKIEKGELITARLLKEVEELSKSFTLALAEAQATLEKAKKKAERKAHQAIRRASMQLEQAPVPDNALVIREEEAVSEAREIQRRHAEAEAAKEKRKSMTLEKRLSRTQSRSSLKFEFQQMQEALAKEKAKNEQRKSQRLSSLYTKEELIAQGIIPAEAAAEPVETYGRIASFKKTALQIYEGQLEVGVYTEMVKNCLHDFANMKDQDYESFKKAHGFEILENGLGNLVGVNHLKPLQAKGYPICSLRVTDAIPERIVFAWSPQEQKAYKVTYVDYH